MYFHYTGHEEESTLINRDRPIVFTMETLIATTKNFDDGNKLGEGCFGLIYKVTWAKKATTCHFYNFKL